MKVQRVELGRTDTRQPSHRNLDRILMMLSLDPQGFPLWQGTLLDLPPKERAVLALLIRASPGVVSKQAFADAAWAGRPMSDESLARCISRLRRTLPEVDIESIYGAGYRLAVAPQAGHARLLAAAQAAPQAVDTHLHARGLAQRRTPAAMRRAQALLRSLLAAHPRYASARVTLAETLAAAATWGLLPSSGFVDEGLAQLDEAHRIDPQTPGIATCRAWLLDLAWRFDEAEQAYAQALTATPADADTLFLHGWHRLVLDDTEAAIERFGQAIAQQPHAPLLRAMLARALAHAGRWEEALNDACMDCSASSACSAALHASACAALGDTARAAQLIVAAVEARCAVVPMLLRDPGNSALREHPQVRPLFEVVFNTPRQ